MNTPQIPIVRYKKPKDIVDDLIKTAYKTLLKTHKKQSVRAVETLRRRIDKLYLEVMDKEAKNELFRPHVKLIEPHPVWNTGKTLPNRVDRVTRW